MSIRFSVLISAYNRAELTRQAVDSALAQTFRDYEVIVVDDGSTDCVPQVLESYGSRIKAFRQSNRGVEAALNQASALAQGEYLCMLDNDDLFFPHTLATYDRIIRSCESPPLILGAMVVFENDNVPSLESNPPAEIKVRRYSHYLSKDEPLDITLSKIVMRRSLFDEVGRFGTKDGTRTDSYLDYNLMLKFGTYGPCVVVQEPCTLARRLHTTNFVRDFQKVTDGILSLARSERQGLYPGGKDSRKSRYAVIGGFAFWWATTRFLPSEPKLALRLFRGTAPMMAVAVWKRLFRCFRRPVPLMVLPASKT